MKWQPASEEELARRGIKPAADEAAEEVVKKPVPKRKPKKAKE
jgi:hypothetical protein